MQIVSGSAKALQPGGDVHAIAKHITIVLDDVAQMDADADVNLLGFLFLSVMGTKLRLNLLGALHGVDDGREVHRKASPMVLMTVP